jgi:hypothetical protein
MFKDPQFWIGALALLVASYAAYFQRKQYFLMLPAPGKRPPKIAPKPWWQFPPLIAAFALAMLAWVPFLLSLWNQPAPSTIAVFGWGTNNLVPGLPINVVITKDDPSIKLMGAAYHYDGTTDLYDVKQLQKSALYDVRIGAVLIMVKTDATFVDEVSSHRHVRTNYVLLSVPASLNAPDFSTLRQATGMGIKTIWSGVGPP